MPISTWIIGIVCSYFVICVCCFIATEYSVSKLVLCMSIISCITGIFGGLRWYYTSTASGVRAAVDERSELHNGLQRTVNVYTANGYLIATYNGKIDIEDDNDGYVLFDYDGKCYTYYNCFVESIADIK